MFIIFEDKYADIQSSIVWVKGFTAQNDSFEKLKLKVEDYIFEHMADTVKTDSERYLGTHIDFKG